MSRLGASASMLAGPRRQRPPLGIVWKIQAGRAAALLILQGVMLPNGADVLAETPDPARMFTFTKAFDAPFTDAGHLYHLAWFIGVSLVAALLTRTLRTSA